MAVTTTKTNKPLNPRGNDQSPKGYNRAELYTGKALDFDGVNDYVDCGTTTNADVVSYAMWVNLDTYSGTGGIIGKGIGGANPHAQIWIYESNLTFFVGSGSGYEKLQTNTPNTGEWFHLVCVADDSTKKQQIYINGVLDVERTFTLSLDDTDRTLIVGALTTSAYRFNGKLNGVKQFNTALTAAQVADLYNNPEKIVPTGVADSALKLWLPMMEGAGTTAYDGSGNGNHGTISGATWTHGIGAPVAQTAVIDWNKGRNVLRYSQKLNTNPNVLDASTYSENEFVSPSGSTDAPKFTETTANDRHGFYQYFTSTAGDFTASIFAKEVDRRYVHFRSNATASTVSSYVDLQDGSVVSSGTGYTISTEDYGNGWWRISASCTATTGSRYVIWGMSTDGTSKTYTGDTDYDFTFWGAQVEFKSEAGPYVRTDATAQTSDVLLPQGLTTGRDITGVNLFENVRKQGALNLDGNSWAEVHDNSSLDITDAITLEAWVYWDYSNTTQGGILGRWNSGEANYLLFKTNANNVRFYINALSSQWSGMTTGWHHIVGTYDKTNRKLYVDGSLKATDAMTANIGTGTSPIDIGQNYGGSNKYDEAIAQPRIYNRALTAEEVERNYNAGKNIYK